MSEYKNIRVRNFYSQVLDWEQEFAPGSETSMYGDCARELSRIDNMSVNSPDDDEEYDNKLDDEIDRVIE